MCNCLNEGRIPCELLVCEFLSSQSLKPPQKDEGVDDSFLIALYFFLAFLLSSVPSPKATSTAVIPV